MGGRTPGHGHCRLGIAAEGGGDGGSGSGWVLDFGWPGSVDTDTENPSP